MYGRTGSATFATGYQPLLELLVLDLQYLDIDRDQMLLTMDLDMKMQDTLLAPDSNLLMHLLMQSVLNMPLSLPLQVVGQPRLRPLYINL